MATELLTWTEVRVAGLTGIDRNIRTFYEGRKRGGGQHEADGWTDHITGAIAELAVAKRFGLYPSRKARDTEGDAGALQVRSSCRHQNLIVRRYDSDDHIFVLVLGFAAHPDDSRLGAVVHIIGWMRGKEAKQDRYAVTGERGPAWFVPGAELHPIESLPVEALRGLTHTAETQEDTRT